MNEDKVKQLVKKSIISTSDSFTDELVQKLENKQIKDTRIIINPFKKVLGPLTIIMVLTGYFTFKFSKHISVTPVFLLAIIFFLVIVNHILRLNEISSQFLKKS